MRYDLAMQTVENAVRAGDIRCAVAAVFCGEAKAADTRAFGSLAPMPGAANVTTRFDLASLTKVVTTTTLLLRYRQQGLLSLDKPVRHWFEGFAGTDKADITLLDLALHRSGLPAMHDFTATSASLQQAAEEIATLPLANPLGGQVLYSDLGFILLGAILEKVGQAGLAALVQNQVLGPLGMETAGYLPKAGLQSCGGNIAPTEYDAALDGCLCGVVHDENARAFGGVSGHAGLFATAKDLARFGQMLLTGRTPEGAPYLNEEALQLLRQNQTTALPGQGRSVGWMVNQPPAGEGNFRENPAGEGWGSTAFGHTGFTGTSLWVEPNVGMVCVLLTNRVCPTRENTAIFPLRRAFHTAAVAEARQ